MTSYRGDSAGKKLTRAAVWLHAATFMQGCFRSPFSGAVVLAGHGGDLSTLKGFGIDLGQVHAVDVCGDAVEFCAELYPASRTHVGRVEEVVASRNVEYNTSHLDFCGGLTIENLRACYAVARGMNVSPGHPGYLAVTMMRGREPRVQANCGPGALVVDAPRAWRRRAIRTSRAQQDPAPGIQLFSGGDFSTPTLLDRTENMLRQTGGPAEELPLFGVRSGRTTPLGKLFVRGSALGAALIMLLAPHGRTVGTNFITGYQSSSTGSAGTPFLTMGLTVHCTEGYTEECAHIRSSAQSLGWSAMHVDLMDAAASMGSLRGFALSLAERMGTEAAALACDLPAGTVRAWRAHDTRGTYGENHGALATICGGARAISDARSAHHFVAAQPRYREQQLGWGRLSGLERIDCDLSTDGIALDF